MEKVFQMKSGKFIGSALLISSAAAFLSDFLTYLLLYCEPYAVKRIFYFIPVMLTALSFFIKGKKASEISMSLSVFAVAAVQLTATFSRGNFSVEILVAAVGYAALGIILIKDCEAAKAADAITVLLIAYNLFLAYFGKIIVSFSKLRTNPVTAEYTGLLLLFALLAKFLSETYIKRSPSRRN